MGSRAHLSLGSLHLTTTKDELDPSLMWAFRPDDKRIVQIDPDDREQMLAYVREQDLEFYGPDNPYSIVQYCCTAGTARDRLDLRGMTRAVAESSFSLRLASEIRRREKQDNPPALIRDELSIQRSLTVAKWLSAMELIIDEQLERINVRDLPVDGHSLTLLEYMRLSWHDFYGFPGFDGRPFLRLVVDLVPDDTPLVYDMSDFVAVDFEDDSDRLVEYAVRLMDEDFLLNRRIIVLAEGTTDRRFIMRSLHVLKPHLTDYFHFFDFDSQRVGGGTGELSRLVRAFVAADVKHRILALFDNDTAGKAAVASLALDTLPDNVKVLHYPDITLARDYPTRGPSGDTRMDVNGLACSIELYLGEDVLSDAEGALTPVQWRAFDDKQRTYQGTILHKSKIADAFEDKLEQCENDASIVDSYDWSGMRAILATMTSAFNEEDKTAILDELQSWDDMWDTFS